jgi:uncharacterized low-complexity protein
MKTFKTLTVGASLSAFMALGGPAAAQQLLESASLDHGYGQAQSTDDKDKKGDKDKHCGADKKKGEKDKKGDKDKHCGADKDKTGDKEHSCGEGSCG